MEKWLLFIFIIVSVISTNKANLIAIKRFIKKRPLRSSINILKYNFVFIFIATVGFNYYYAVGIKYIPYSSLVVLIVTLNVILSLIIQKLILKKEITKNNLIGLFLIISGIYLVLSNG